MSFKQFRIRDVLINVPVESEGEGSSVRDCAEAPSVVGCIDGESLICGDNRNTWVNPTLCWNGGISQPPTFCWNGGISRPLTLCWNGGISPNPCDLGGPTPICGVNFSTFVDGVNMPFILERVAGATDLATLKGELRQIMGVLDEYEQPSREEELDVLEQRLNDALEEVRARRQGSK